SLASSGSVSIDRTLFPDFVIPDRPFGFLAQRLRGAPYRTLQEPCLRRGPVKLPRVCSRRPRAFGQYSRGVSRPPRTSDPPAADRFQAVGKEFPTCYAISEGSGS